MDNIFPKKIKRIRKKKFTKIRSPYKDYLSASWEWSDVFDELDSMVDTKKFIKITAKKYNINYGTLKNKYYYYKNNKIKNINDENRGGGKRKLTDKQDRMLYEYIKVNYIDTEEVLNNNIIREIVKEKFKKENIVVSKWWVSNFKKRWNLSTQKVKPSKIATNIPTENQLKLFLDECDSYKNKVKKNFFSTMTKQIIIS